MSRIITPLVFCAVGIATALMPAIALADEFVCRTGADVEALAQLADHTVAHDLRGDDALAWVATLNRGLAANNAGIVLFGDRVVVAYADEGQNAAVSVLIRGCLAIGLTSSQEATERLTSTVLDDRAEQ